MSKSRVIVRVAVVVVLAVVVLIGVEIANPSPYEVEFPRSTGVKLRFTPSHPYLAEYDRSVVFTNRQGKSLSAKLFPDTGGYARTQLYEGRDGRLYLEGYFDLAVLDPSGTFIDMGSHEIPSGSKYVGAIDLVSREGLRFLSPEESPEQRLVVKGG